MSMLRDAKGFTLMEVIVAVAIVALVAGAIAPVVYKQINSARAKATVEELALLEAGLIAFYEDAGRFPTEGEGLAALVTDPGVDNWLGPYVSVSRTNPLDAVRADAFGQDYIYDVSPETTPAGVADLLISSPGANLSSDAGRLNHNWDLDADTDDIFVIMSSAAIDRDMEREVRDELGLISSACSRYYEDNAAFPQDLTDLEGIYMDAGFEGAAFRDAWSRKYLVLEYGGGGALTLRVYSSGPDLQDDSGGDDDLSILISSVPPGRRSTLNELEIAQAALNNDPELPLLGGWPGPSGIRSSLGLAGVFDLDGWGNSYGVNVSSRVVFSCGPDGDAGSTSDNIPVGVGP